jgi:very-short-patch-repair endonuclease
MSRARLGKEPANKAFIDIEKLRHLYVGERKNAYQVSQELGVSHDAVKNRLRALGWSRSTKESCSSGEFKEQMRQIRIKTLISKPVLESPNKLERAVYNALDKLGVSYQKQIPLFNKFVVDVLFPQNNLILEIFGRYWHELPINKKKDFSKKKYLIKCGYKVEEIWDDEIKKVGIVPVLQSVLNKYNLWPES